MKGFSLFLPPALIVIGADQLAKGWAWAALWNPVRTMILVPDWLQLTPVATRGLALELFRDRGLALLLLLILAVIISGSWRDLLDAPRSIKVAIGLIIGGDISNMLDRGHLGYVIDFITLPNLPVFQVFNIADAAITIGGLLLALAVWPATRDHGGTSAGGHMVSFGKGGGMT